MTAESDKAKKKRLTLEYSEQTFTRLNEMQLARELVIRSKGRGQSILDKYTGKR